MSADELTLGIYKHSIGRGEVRNLYDAIERAANGEEMTLVRYGKRIRLVLEDAPAGCDPCREGRREDCLVVWSQAPDDACGCDQQTVHARITAECVAAYRMSRRVR